MDEVSLTNEEKRCLQMWFRQAIAHVEKEEATRSLLRTAKAANTVRGAHSGISVRRAKRNRTGIIKELV